MGQGARVGAGLGAWGSVGRALGMMVDRFSASAKCGRAGGRPCMPACGRVRARARARVAGVKQHTARVADCARGHSMGLCACLRARLSPVGCVRERAWQVEQMMEQHKARMSKSRQEQMRLLDALACEFNQLEAVESGDSD